METLPSPLPLLRPEQEEEQKGRNPAVPHRLFPPSFPVGVLLLLLPGARSQAVTEEEYHPPLEIVQEVVVVEEREKHRVVQVLVEVWNHGRQRRVLPRRCYLGGTLRALLRRRCVRCFRYGGLSGLSAPIGNDTIDHRLIYAQSADWSFCVNDFHSH